jgi:hypothetical protein
MTIVRLRSIGEIDDHNDVAGEGKHSPPKTGGLVQEGQLGSRVARFDPRFKKL